MSLEPNIKEGKGGLRDLHTLFWIAKYIYRVDDCRPSWSSSGVLTRRGGAPVRAARGRFLWTVRCHLHYLAGRAEERLTFDLQPEIGAPHGLSPTMPGTPRRRALHEALFPASPRWSAT